MQAGRKLWWRMARAGVSIENPVTGERLLFRTTGRESNGELLQLELFVKPYGLVAAPHVHALQDERVQVISGHVRFRIGRGPEQPLGARQLVAFPLGAPHVWWNDGDSQAHVLVEFRPALRSEAFFETIFGFARDGKTDQRGMPGLLHLSVLASEYEFYPPGLPIPIRRAVFRTLSALPGALLALQRRRRSGPLTRRAWPPVPAITAGTGDERKEG